MSPFQYEAVTGPTGCDERLQLRAGFKKALWKADSPAAGDTGLLSQAENGTCLGVTPGLGERGFILRYLSFPPLCFLSENYIFLVEKVCLVFLNIWIAWIPVQLVTRPTSKSSWSACVWSLEWSVGMQDCLAGAGAVLSRWQHCCWAKNTGQLKHQRTLESEGTGKLCYRNDQIN